MKKPAAPASTATAMRASGKKPLGENSFFSPYIEYQSLRSREHFSEFWRFFFANRLARLRACRPNVNFMTLTFSEEPREQSNGPMKPSNS